MQHVSSLHGADVPAQQFDLERGAVAVAVDDGAHIARDQAVLGEIAIQLTRKSFQPPAASLVLALLSAVQFLTQR